MASANQTSDLSIKRMGTALRNMGLASLLVLVIPAIGFWYFYLAGQLAIAARDAAKAYNSDQFQKVKRITTANLIVSGTFFLIAVGIWLAAVIQQFADSGGGSGYSTMSEYFQSLIWGSGCFIIAWGITSACLNIGLWRALSDYFKNGSWGNPQDLGQKGCKAGLVGSSIGLIAWGICIPIALLASVLVNGYFSTPHPPAETTTFLISALSILLAITGLHFAASICTQVAGFFKAGSALQEVDATRAASLTGRPVAVLASSPTSQNAVSRVLYDAAAYIPDPVPVKNDAMNPQSQQDAVEAMDSMDTIEGVVETPAPAMPASGSNEVPVQTSQIPTNQASTSPLERLEPATTRPRPQFCPHCGNSLKIDQSTGKCEYCGEKVFLG